MGAPVREGEILAGKYRVERVLGQGGMGVVVAARHVELDELVALKFLLPEALSEPEAVARFLKEARAAVRIKSEHVARVHDVGQLDSGAPYIVMEYLEGSDLGALLRKRPVLPVEDVIDYVLQACEAIANAHSLGIVHRDLKPSNLMLVVRSDGSECIKVLDFGISKVSSIAGRESSMNMTKTAAVLGSPLYMSPEQMMSARDVDGRTDIWALGTILYELLTGKPPFMADTLPALGVLIATRQAPPIRTLRPEVPAGVEAVAACCLEKGREQRFANVAELAQALAPFAPERSLVSVDRASRILHVAGGDPASRLGRTPPRQSSVPPGLGTPGPGAGTPRPGSGTPRPESGPLTATPGSGSSPLTATPGPGQEPREPVLPWRQTATASNFGHTAPVSRSRRKLITAAGVLVVIAIASGVALFTFGHETPAPRAAAAPPSVAPAALPPPVTLPDRPVAAPPVALVLPPPVDPDPPPATPPVRHASHATPAPHPATQPAPGRPSPPSTSEPPAPGQKAAYEDM